MRHFISSFSYCLIVTTLFVVGAPANVFAQFVADDLEFPYQALVLNEDASVHSGPGAVHYETERLNQGAIVEVYRHDPGAWCAIRPVEGSFSLVPESALEIVDAGVGRVTSNGTQAWVGTALGPVEKPLWQIKLQKDELVEVLGQTAWPNPEGHSTVWYQIAPPAGEFRWIRMSDIQMPVKPRISHTPAPNPIANSNQATVGNVQSFAKIPSPYKRVQPRNDASVVAPAMPVEAPYAVQQASYQAEPKDVAKSLNRGWRRASGPIELSAPAHRNFASGNVTTPSSPYVANERLRSNPGSSVRIPSSDAPVRVASLDLTPQSFAGLRSSDLGRSLGLGAVGVDELDDVLTKEMAEKNPRDWDLEAIESAVNRILESTVDPTEGAKARRLSDKLANAMKVRDGYRSSLASKTLPAVTSNSLLGTGASKSIDEYNSTSKLDARSLDAAMSARYDAMGWLHELVRDGGQSKSSYVLQNDSGKIIYHVAPGPGINIHRYLKSKVGVIGQRGYHTRYQLDHVTAQQVVELEKAGSRANLRR